MIWKFTSCSILRIRRESLAAVKVEITKNNDFRERRRRENILCFGILPVEEFKIASWGSRKIYITTKNLTVGREES